MMHFKGLAEQEVRRSTFDATNHPLSALVLSLLTLGGLGFDPERIGYVHAHGHLRCLDFGLPARVRVRDVALAVCLTLHHCRTPYSGRVVLISSAHLDDEPFRSQPSA